MAQEILKQLIIGCIKGMRQHRISNKADVRCFKLQTATNFNIPDDKHFKYIR